MAHHVDIPGITVRVNASVVHLEVRLIADGLLEPSLVASRSSG
jgi:hypothetical protein